MTMVYMRSLEEILDQAVANTLLRLRQEPIKEKVVKRTGNKKALHQKNKNKRCNR